MAVMGCCEHGNEPSVPMNGRKFLEHLSAEHTLRIRGDYVRENPHEL
jgi:hypothetical protein